MMYIGVKDNEPLVMHNMWSVRLKDDSGKKYRHIIGKATVTTLEPGKGYEDFDEETNLLNRNSRNYNFINPRFILNHHSYHLFFIHITI